MSTIIITQSKNRFFRALPLVLFCILYLVACPLSGQALQKKHLAPAAYPLWGRIETGPAAPNEKWISYGMHYEIGADTLYLQNAANGRTFTFPSASKPFFTRDNFFMCINQDTLRVLDPQTGRNENIKAVQQYVYSNAANLLVMSIGGGRKTNTMIIKSPLGKTLQEIADVEQFSISPDGRKLLYTVLFNDKSSIFVVDLLRPGTTKWILKSADSQYETFTWQKDAKAVAFYCKTAAQKPIKSLLLYKLEKDQLTELDPIRQAGFPKDYSIIKEAPFEIIISDDLEKIFFPIKKSKKTVLDPEDSKVEVWNANDKYVYAFEQRHGKFEQASKIVLWEPEKGTVNQINSAELPMIILSTDHKYALLSNPKAYEPQYEDDGPRDYFILDLATLEKNIFLAKQSAYRLDILVSPTGRYISYFRDKNWWVYDVAAKKHSNITGNLGVPFSGKIHELKDNFAFGNPGWSVEDKEILLYDEFDLWAIAPDGSSSRKLTHGRESKIKYRLNLVDDVKNIYESPKLAEYNLDRELFFRLAGEDGKTGYAVWKKGSAEKVITYGDSSVNDLHFGLKKQRLFWLEQRFNLSPILMSKEKSSPAKTIFQSNKQQHNYYWGKNELIRFQNSKKQNLKGILYYPANYDAQKKYPMIVRIYEKQSQKLHNYINPTLYNESGFNVTVFTTEGYFVFLPDIVHEKENVGPSTVDCVVSGTEKILELGLVDPKKIALTGHSFGGYETAFVINYSHIFATAIASGAIVDLTRKFLTLGTNRGQPQMWRFNTGGWRMGEKTPFTNRSDFDRNSPLESIENLKIPLLMWSGKEDTQVDPFQSMEYYLALRRLGKKCVFLQYPGEGHTLEDSANQKDATIRMLQWLEYYLKGETTTEWISNGTL
ncbi:prolyl oligopeptidase family serine peptidase [Flavobacterium sp. FlaQc-28]|uniref:S9 family peptidase n=1 Tax=Flavobacterium sp. FlaQc-28 TaxID=3374178 RepID=UPI00375657FA